MGKVIAGIGLLLILAVGGMYLFGFKIPPILPAESEKLVEVYGHGGLCPNGECRSRAVIYRSGKVLNYGNDLVNISRSETDSLFNLILRTDFEKIRAVKFTGMCPTSVDGLEYVYTFYLSDRKEELRSCTSKIDMNSELFRKINQLIR